MKLSNARGIVVAAVGPHGDAIAEKIYAEHAKTDVFPIVVTARPGSGAGSGSGVSICADDLTAADFPGKTHLTAAASRLKTAEARVLFIFPDAGHLTAYQFSAAVSALKKATGVYFQPKTRILVLYDQHGPAPKQHLFTSDIWTKSWFASRAIIGDLTGLPAGLPGAEDVDEMVSRLDHRFGLDPFDPWPPAVARRQSRNAATDETLEHSIILAATPRGLATALLNAAETVYGWSRDDALVVEDIYVNADGGAARRTVAFPIACANRGSPRYFATVLETTVPVWAAAGPGKKPVRLPAGTRVDWDGACTADVIFDESTLENGVHFEAPEALGNDERGPAVLRGTADGAGPVEVPVYVATARGGVRIALRVAGFAPAFGEPPTVAGTLATSPAARRGSRNVHLVGEPYTQKQYRAAVSLCGSLDVPVVPGGSRLSVLYPPPYGAGPEPEEPLGAVADRMIKRRRTIEAGL